MTREEVTTYVTERLTGVVDKVEKIEKWQDTHDSEHKKNQKEIQKTDILLTKMSMTLDQIKKDREEEKKEKEKNKDRKWSKYVVYTGWGIMAALYVFDKIYAIITP